MTSHQTRLCEKEVKFHLSFCEASTGCFHSQATQINYHSLRIRLGGVVSLEIPALRVSNTQLKIIRNPSKKVSIPSKIDVSSFHSSSIRLKGIWASLLVIDKRL